jgi:hypothetical protein
MTMKIGRVSLRTPERVRPVRRNSVEDAKLLTGFSNPAKTGVGARGFMVHGSEQGTNAQTLIDALDKEAARIGSIYIIDDSGPAALPAGYYLIADFQPEYPSGAPRYRPYDLTLWESPAPVVIRQGEDDNSAGSDIADATADEGFHCAFTPTTADSVLLRPGSFAGTEAFNLPAGNYRCIARVYQVTNNSALFRWSIRDGSDNLITDGAQVAIGAADQWVDLDLGVLAVPQANDRSNWYSLKVQGIAAQLGQVRVDRLIFYPA